VLQFVASLALHLTRPLDTRIANGRRAQRFLVGRLSIRVRPFVEGVSGAAGTAEPERNSDAHRPDRDDDSAIAHP
jgi:hypothetical protein